MSDSKSKEEVLSAEEIDALVERASEPGFDDGEFRTHDFSGGETVAMTKVDRTIVDAREAFRGS